MHDECIQHACKLVLSRSNSSCSNPESNLLNFFALENHDRKATPKPVIRVGLLMNNFTVNFPYYHIIETLKNSGYATISLVVLNKQKKKITAGKIFKNLNSAFFHIYQRADKKLFRNRHNVLYSKDTKSILADVPVLEVDPLTKNYLQWIPEKDIEAIKTYNIDVFIRMGFRILKEDILNSSRYGIWSYHHADNKINRGGPPGFWEMFYTIPVTGTVVQQLSNDLDNGLLLAKTYGATHKFSLNRGRNSVYAKGMFLLPRLVERLYEEGDAFIKTETGFPPVYSHKLFTGPTNLQVVSFLLKMVPYSFLKYIKQLLYRNQWFLLFGLTKNNSPQTSMRKLKKINPPQGTFWADPHVIFRDNRYYVFLEEKFFNRKNAHISFITLDEKGNCSPATKVLERPYHLSYPFVFSWQGNDYMIPETSSNKTIELYKCDEFPSVWTLQKTIMDNVIAVDCTLHEHNGTWYMFVNISQHAAMSKNDELHIYCSDSPVGNWQSHPQNPVVSDVRRARPAGKIFSFNNKLYRPSQDCSVTYGYGIRINEILELSKHTYSEKEIDFIEPLWDDSIYGVHSFAFENNLTLIDGFRKVPRWKI